MHPHDETLFVSGDYQGSIMFWHVNSEEPIAVRASGEQGAVGAGRRGDSGECGDMRGRAVRRCGAWGQGRGASSAGGVGGTPAWRFSAAVTGAHRRAAVRR